MTFCCDTFGITYNAMLCNFFTPLLVCILISTPVRTETITHALSSLSFLAEVFRFGCILMVGLSRWLCLENPPTPRPPSVFFLFFLFLIFGEQVRSCFSVQTLYLSLFHLEAFELHCVFSLVNIRCFVNLSARFHCDYAQFAWIPETAMGRCAQSCTRLHGQRHWDG